MPKPNKPMKIEVVGELPPIDELPEATKKIVAQCIGRMLMRRKERKDREAADQASCSTSQS